MVKKLIGVLLIVVMTVSMAACGKPSKKPEAEQAQKEKKYPYGFRGYRTEVSTDGTAGERKIFHEYENLVSTVTETIASDGIVLTQHQYFYDEDGEILLKEIDDSMNFKEVSEYDQKGRLILNVKTDKSDGLFGDEMSITPYLYNWANSELRDELWNFQLRARTKELRTELTYNGDSEIPASIRTLTDSGDEFMHMDLGEHGEVVYVLYKGGMFRYEETYDAAERKGAWKLYYLNDAGEPDEVVCFGENLYNEAGRRSQWLEYDDDYDGNPYLFLETTFSYDSDGYSAVQKTLRDSGRIVSERRERYDNEDRMVREENYSYDGDKYSDASISTDTYYDNGEHKSSSKEVWDAAAQKFLTEFEEEYNEDGELIAERTYSGGVLTEEKIVTFMEEEGIAGPVKAVAYMFYEDGKCTGRKETYAVRMKDLYGEVYWLVYRKTETNKSGKIKEKKTSTVFDEEGRLVMSNLTADDLPEYIEYDIQGRMIKQVTNDGYGGQIIDEYEYWDERPGS